MMKKEDRTTRRRCSFDRGYVATPTNDFATISNYNEEYMHDTSKPNYIVDEDIADETTIKLSDDDKKEKVNHPQHYLWLKELCGIEVIDIVRHLDIDKGSAVKYILRSGYKEEKGYSAVQKEIEDIEKAIWCLNDKLKTLKEHEYLSKVVSKNKGPKVNEHEEFY